MTQQQLPIHLDIHESRMLLADWFIRLARERDIPLEQCGNRGDAYTLGDRRKFFVTARFIDSSPFLNFIASDMSHTDIVAEIAAKAVDYYKRGDLGGNVWYSGEIHESKLRYFLSSPIGDLVQRLGSQTRIIGWRRLGSSTLLEFTEKPQESEVGEVSILAPEAVVHFHIATPGPCAGYFSSAISHGLIETVGAICSFALGRPVEIPPVIFSTDCQDLSDLDAHRADPTILTLARQGIALDIVNYLEVDGGHEIFRRMRNALFSFDAAVRQERDSVAGILYVVAAECLTTPSTDWSTSKLTKRFIEFFDELLTEDLDKLIAHDNFEESFGIRRGKKSHKNFRREALNRFYSYRSGQLHDGLDPSYSSFRGGLDCLKESRRGLLRDFAEAAILRYLAAPRSSLIGHPMFSLHSRLCDREHL